MPFGIYPGEAVFDDGDFEAGFEKVLGGVADAVFGGDAGNIHDLGPEQAQHLGKALARIVAPFETGVLLLGRVASLIKRKFLVHEGKQVVVDLGSSGSGHAVGRPGAALRHEGAVVGRMMVADEEHGQLPDSRHVHGLMDGAAGGGAVAEENGGDAVLFPAFLFRADLRAAAGSFPRSLRKALLAFAAV